ncbi:unnamed protein product [Prorocentrum cordatum]|uniref:Uncharacterized protein n=1 Tax=Prorocentrum cordatum TaxID=2364126 RepID=A0ABN9U1W4_9DINO|nr:unnamed protein product [Polarella glacialis]
MASPTIPKDNQWLRKLFDNFSANRGASGDGLEIAYLRVAEAVKAWISNWKQAWKGLVDDIPSRIADNRIQMCLLCRKKCGRVDAAHCFFDCPRVQDIAKGYTSVCAKYGTDASDFLKLVPQGALVKPALAHFGAVYRRFCLDPSEAPEETVEATGDGHAARADAPRLERAEMQEKVHAAAPDAASPRPRNGGARPRAIGQLPSPPRPPAAAGEAPAELERGGPEDNPLQHVLEIADLYDLQAEMAISEAVKQVVPKAAGAGLPQSSVGSTALPKKTQVTCTKGEVSLIHCCLVTDDFVPAVAEVNSVLRASWKAGCGLDSRVEGSYQEAVLQGVFEQLREEEDEREESRVAVEAPEDAWKAEEIRAESAAYAASMRNRCCTLESGERKGKGRSWRTRGARAHPALFGGRNDCGDVQRWKQMIGDRAQLKRAMRQRKSDQDMEDLANACDAEGRQPRQRAAAQAAAVPMPAGGDRVLALPSEAQRKAAGPMAWAWAEARAIEGLSALRAARSRAVLDGMGRELGATSAAPSRDRQTFYDAISLAKLMDLAARAAPGDRGGDGGAALPGAHVRIRRALARAREAAPTLGPGAFADNAAAKMEGLEKSATVGANETAEFVRGRAAEQTLETKGPWSASVNLRAARGRPLQGRRAGKRRAQLGHADDRWGPAGKSEQFRQCRWVSDEGRGLLRHGCELSVKDGGGVPAKIEEGGPAMEWHPLRATDETHGSFIDHQGLSRDARQDAAHARWRAAAAHEHGAALAGGAGVRHLRGKLGRMCYKKLSIPTDSCRRRRNSTGLQMSRSWCSFFALECYKKLSIPTDSCRRRRNSTGLQMSRSWCSFFALECYKKLSIPTDSCRRRRNSTGLQMSRSWCSFFALECYKKLSIPTDSCRRRRNSTGLQMSRSWCSFFALECYKKLSIPTDSCWRGAWMVDRVELLLGDGATRAHGGSGGEYKGVERLEPGEHLQQVEQFPGQGGFLGAALHFVTSRGRRIELNGYGSGRKARQRATPEKFEAEGGRAITELQFDAGGRLVGAVCEQVEAEPRCKRQRTN